MVVGVTPRVPAAGWPVGVDDGAGEPLVVGDAVGVVEGDDAEGDREPVPDGKADGVPDDSGDGDCGPPAPLTDATGNPGTFEPPPGPPREMAPEGDAPGD